MKRSFLADLFKKHELEVPKEVIDGILDENGSDVESEKSKTQEAIDKAKALEKDAGDSTKLQEKLDALQAELDSEKEKATTLEAEKKTLESSIEETKNNLTKSHSVDMALVGAKAKNLKAVKALISKEQMDSIVFEDGKSEQLDSIIEGLVKTDSYLFGEDTGYSPAGGKGDPAPTEMIDVISQQLNSQKS